MFPLGLEGTLHWPGGVMDWGHLQGLAAFNEEEAAAGPRVEEEPALYWEETKILKLERSI